ncbi:hypothetical protein RHMOL_Rhmol05G0002500 [Rhododendron molle]|uniref:Uncharacterized protein n=2 Tax=Rhododendron molle TaxID=49168 RepID=A0ACC0NKD9_RHOML|nr:hypothetical protein RHMOL_Rhmol05G0002500 [Rhododendron molle]KAI8553270.1 hypothetical protein RHMOL_Rhmol05G0002500 [Rhododendron molle]
MEGLQKAFRAISENPKLAQLGMPSSSSCSVREGGGGGGAAALSNHSGVLITRPPRQSVSLWTCSKLCTICFVAGVIAGYTWKRRVRRWASKLLRRIKDD